MNFSDLENNGINIIDVSSDSEETLISGWKNTLKIIELTLSDAEDVSEKDRILKKLTNVINVLVRYGETYEDSVLETALLYVFAKEAKINIDDINENHSEFVVEGVSCLVNASGRNAHKEIFENQGYKYLGKIKIAECLVDLASKIVDKKYLAEIDDIIKNYKDRSHNKLMKMLIESRNSNK